MGGAFRANTESNASNLPTLRMESYRLRGSVMPPKGTDALGHTIKHEGTMMNESEPITTLSAFSSTHAEPTAWSRGRAELRDAEVYWLSTVRPNGRPHITPLLGIWTGDALYFCTGTDERKAKNLTRNPRCTLMTARPLEDPLEGRVGSGSVEVARDRRHHLGHVRVRERVTSVFQPEAASGRDGCGESVAVLDRQERVGVPVYYEGGCRDRAQMRVSGAGHGDSSLVLQQCTEVESVSFAQVVKNDPGPLFHVDRFVSSLRDQPRE
jgi:hypothetical protein